MSQATFTFRVDEELKTSFSSVAKSLDRSGAQLLRDYMRDIVRRQRETEEYDLWFRDQVEDGIRSANKESLVSNEEAEARFSARREELRRRLDESA